MEKISLKGKVIWFFGLSGAGKTTLADKLAKELKDKGLKVERLDGDNTRQAICKDLGFTRKDIYENIRRVGYIADILSKNDITVIASFITPHETGRILLNALLGNRLILVYVLATPQDCWKRDPKGLWLKALQGEVENLAGFDAPFEEPNRSHGLVIDVVTSYCTEEESYETLKMLLQWWGHEI